MQFAVAQDNELLFHYNRYKEHIYKVGDVISFRIKGNVEKHTWQITNLTDSTIVSGERSIEPHQISHIYVDKETLQFFAFRYKWARLFFFAGVGYAAIDLVNRHELDRNMALISGSLLGASLLCTIIIKEHIELKHGRKLVILR
jgi:hypothetical protein